VYIDGQYFVSRTIYPFAKEIVRTFRISETHVSRLFFSKTEMIEGKEQVTSTDLGTIKVKFFTVKTVHRKKEEKKRKREFKPFTTNKKLKGKNAIGVPITTITSDIVESKMSPSLPESDYIMEFVEDKATITLHYGTLDSLVFHGVVQREKPPQNNEIMDLTLEDEKPSDQNVQQIMEKLKDAKNEVSKLQKLMVGIQTKQKTKTENQNSH